ncbi:MAG: hypothetical protein K2L14_06800 [Duncaniella sp.]|nr:hypothetical protein [Duncaniella sp.]
MRLLPAFLSACALAAAQSIEAQSFRYELPSVVSDTVIPIVIPASAPPHSLKVSARAAAADKSSGWALMFVADTDTMSVNLNIRQAGYFDPFDHSDATVSVMSGHKKIGSATFTSELASSPGEYNTLTVNISSRHITISGGHRHLARLLDIDNPLPVVPARVMFEAKGKVEVSEMTASVIPVPELVAATAWTAQEIADYLTTSPLDPIEGYWDYLDRNTTPRRAREGGRYTLAIVKSKDRPGTYDILYLSGARVYSDKWMPAMRKGRLIPTDYIDHYDLEWIDATFRLRTLDMHASVEQSSILTLSFHLLHSSLRFTLR